MLDNIQVLVVAPVFAVDLLLQGLFIGAIFALAAYGLALVWGVMNVKNLAQGETNASGIFGFPTPPDCANHEIEIVVKSDHHNTRRIRMDETTPASGLGERLYGPN